MIVMYGSKCHGSFEALSDFFQQATEKDLAPTLLILTFPMRNCLEIIAFVIFLPYLLECFVPT